MTPVVAALAGGVVTGSLLLVTPAPRSSSTPVWPSFIISQPLAESRARWEAFSGDVKSAHSIEGQQPGAHSNKEHVLLVPDAAVLTDYDRQIALVVDPSGTVTVRPVKLGKAANGLRLVKSGLRTQDQVIILGAQYAQPGSKVEARRGDIANILSWRSKGT